MTYEELQKTIGGVATLMSYPALTVQIFCRKRIGFRNLKPGPIVLLAMFMWLFLSLSHRSSNLEIFAGAAEETQRETPLIPLGWNALQPSNWEEMTIEQQQAWVKQHRITDPSALKLQNDERIKELAQRQKDAEARAAVAAAWRKVRAALAYWPMVLFIWVFLIWALIQRRLRWHDLLRGIPWHSYSRGLSYLHPLFKDIMREPNVQRFIDPLACFIVGLFVVQVSRPLGSWIIFSSFCFYMVEQYVYEKQLDQAIDQQDNLVSSEAGQSVMKHFKPGAAASALPTMAETGGILTTGVASPELAMQAARRREERRARLKKKASPSEGHPAQAEAGNIIEYGQYSNGSAQSSTPLHSPTTGPMSWGIAAPTEDDRL